MTQPALISDQVLGENSKVRCAGADGLRQRWTTPTGQEANIASLSGKPLSIQETVAIYDGYTIA